MSRKRYVYRCDGGTIMIGNASCRVCIPNGYGDGAHDVYVYNINDAGFNGTGYEFVGTIQGDIIYVYDYDCLVDYELNDAHILCTLNEGRYAIYVNNGTVALVQWD